MSDDKFGPCSLRKNILGKMKVRKDCIKLPARPIATPKCGRATAHDPHRSTTPLRWTARAAPD